MATTTNYGWTTPDNTDLVKDGALAIRTLGSAIDTSLGGAFTSWTPVLTASTTNPTLGTGSTASGSYKQISKLVIAQFNLTFGTSGVNAGSGFYRCSIPTGTIKDFIGGIIYAYDTSTGQRQQAYVVPASSTTFEFQYSAASNPAFSSTAPWTWAASDFIRGYLIYEAS